jgi:hypothetical protein
MRIKCIACDVLARPVYLAAAHSPHVVDVVLERFGLHNTPVKLREVLQAHVDSADQAGDYDSVVLAYGLCGKATHGLSAGSVSLVIPRAHDCITLFLGGRARYGHEFSACPGTYWYVQDYIERGETENTPLSIGAFTAGDADALYDEYVQKYGADNAAYLMEAMQAWQAHYERAAYIDLGVGDGQKAAERARGDAQRRGWRFERLAGDLVLIRRLLNADWGEDFLVLQPGQAIEMTGGEEIIQVKNITGPE